MGKYVSASKSRTYNVGDVIAGAYPVVHVFEGGLGIVYVVQHPSGDFVVLKTVKDQAAQTAQFRREAETWVELGSHANIVKAFWVDELAGMLCIAAELIEPDEIGRLSLRDYLQYGVLTTTQIVRFAAQFCYGLEHAIGRGLVSHRDVKPENLLIGRSGDLKITDFGIASAALIVDDSQSSRGKLGRWRSAGQEFAGTPPYMAPEQIACSPDQDQRVDIYAFGIVLYEMTYGKLPFVGRTPADYFNLHLHVQPTIPPGPFSELIGRCLMKEPSRRYSGVAALFQDLQRLCRVQNLKLPPKPEPTDTRLEELRARAHSLGALGRLDEAIQNAEELVRQAPRDPSNWAQLGRLLHERGYVRDAKEATSRSLALDPTRSAPWNNLGLLLGQEGKWDEAIEVFDRAIHCDGQNTGAMANASLCLMKIGKMRDAIRRLQWASEIAPDKFSIWTNLASLYVRINDDANALTCFQRARALAPERYWRDLDECIRDTEERIRGG